MKKALTLQPEKYIILIIYLFFINTRVKQEKAMSFTSVSVIILPLIALTVFLQSRKGYKKGLSKSLISFSAVLFSVFFGALTALWVSAPLSELAFELLSEADFYAEISDMLMGFEEVLFLVVKMLLTLILYVPAFYLTRLIIALCVGAVCKYKFKAKDKNTVDYYKENEELYVRKNKAIAAFVGALSGFLISIVVWTPVTGALKTVSATLDFAESVTGESVLDEEIEEPLSYYSDDFSVSLVSGCGGKMLFNFATTVSVDGEYTDLTSELEALRGINFNEFGELVQFEADSAETAARIKALTDQMEKSKIMKLAFVSTVRDLSKAWLNEEAYMGAWRPHFEDYKAIDAFINEILYVCSDSTSETISADINTLVNVSYILIEEADLFLSGDYSDIMSNLAFDSADNVITRIKDELEKNAHMRPVLYAVDELIMSVVAEEVQDYSKYTAEDCDELFFEISDLLTSTGDLSEDARLSAVTNSIKEQLDSYGVYVPDTLNETIASSLIEGIGSFGGDVSYDDVKQYFEKFLSDGDISDFFP